MLTKLQTIRHSQGLHQSAISIGGSLVAAGLSAIATLIITRKLGPEEFGIFSVGFALIQILVRLTDFGMTAVVQRFAGGETNKTEINTFFSFTTKVRLITWIVLCVIGLIFGNLIASALNFQYPEIIIISFILTGATYFYEHFQAMLQSIQRFGQAAFVNITQSSLKALLSLALVLAVPLTTFWVFCGYMIAPVIPFIFYKKLFPSWVRLTEKAELKDKAQAVFQFARHSAVGFVCAGIIENVDILFVQKYLTTYEAGLLGGASKVALLFSVIAYSLASVLNPRVARYKTKSDIKAYSGKAALILAASLAGIVAFIPLAKPILMLTIGEAYLPALPTLIILVASSLLTVAAVPFIALFFSFNKPSYFSISGVLQVAIILSGNALFIPEYGLEAAAWTRLVARIALLVITLCMAWWAYSREYAKAS